MEVPRDVPGNFLTIGFILGITDRDKDGITTQEDWDKFGAMRAANQSPRLASGRGR